MQTTARDERRALAFAADLARCEDRAGFNTVALTLTDLVGADSAFVAIDASVGPGPDGTLTITGTTDQPEVYNAQTIGAMRSRWREHPVVVRQLRSMVQRPEKISDHVSAVEWRRGALYNEAYRPTGAEHEMSVHLAWGRDRVECASLNRHRSATDFGERDRTLLGMVAPHLRAARDRVELIAAQRRQIAVLERMDQHGTATLLDRGRAAATARLTPRQVEVAALLVEGLSGPAIAERLQITPRTADSHIEHIYRRLGAHNRAQAIAILLGGATSAT